MGDNLVAVFIFALIQYRRSESWKKTEYVARLYKDFSDDEFCQRALWMLQGDKRTIYYKQGDKLLPYKYDHEVLNRALKTAIDEGNLNPAQLDIRDTLDRFFVYIEQFERAIRRGLVEQVDVYPYFGYWIALLNGDEATIPKKVLKTVQEYIDVSGFDDVQKFLARKWE